MDRKYRCKGGNSQLLDLGLRPSLQLTNVRRWLMHHTPMDSRTADGIVIATATGTAHSHCRVPCTVIVTVTLNCDPKFGRVSHPHPLDDEAQGTFHKQGVTPFTVPFLPQITFLCRSDLQQWYPHRMQTPTSV